MSRLRRVEASSSLVAASAAGTARRRLVAEFRGRGASLIAGSACRCPPARPRRCYLPRAMAPALSLVAASSADASHGAASSLRCCRRWRRRLARRGLVRDAARRSLLSAAGDGADASRPRAASSLLPSTGAGAGASLIVTLSAGASLCAASSLLPSAGAGAGASLVAASPADASLGAASSSSSAGAGASLCASSHKSSKWSAAPPRVRSSWRTATTPRSLGRRTLRAPIGRARTGRRL